MSNVGTLIKNRRIELGLSQEYVGKAVGVSAATVSRWEGGQIANMTRSRIADLAKVLRLSPMDIIDFNPNFEPTEGAIPLLGRIACGTPILAEENIEEYITLPSGIRADYALRCRGDSMIGAGIRDGDIVFIRQTPDVDDGQIAAVRLGDDATLKRVFHLQGGVMLMAEDKDRTRRTFSGPQKTEMEIMGQAVAYLHKLV